MIIGLSAENVLSWSAQVFVIATLGALLPSLLRLRHPRSLLVYCHLLLAACITLPFIQQWERPIVTAGNASISETVPVAIPVVDGTLSGSTFFNWESVVIWILVAGIAARLVWLLLGVWRIRRYRAGARLVEPATKSVRYARRLINVDADICLSMSSAGPVTFGFFRPVILLPKSFLGLSGEAQRGILCHELLHVKRRDWQVTVLEQIIGSFLWFQPAMWWLLAQTRLAREQLVDDQVVRLTGDREPYIDALLNMAGANPDHGFLPAPGFLWRRQLTERVHLLLMEASVSKLRLLSSYVSIVTILVVAGSLSLVSFPLMGEPQVRETPAPDGQGIAVIPGGNILRRNPISYPPEAAQKRIEGTVVSQLTVNGAGKVTDARILSGPEELRKIVLQSVLQWRYAVDPQPSRILQASVRFQLPPLAPLPANAGALISNEEKAAYNALKTDEEREMFIEQFWLRRQPRAAVTQRLREEPVRVGNSVTSPKLISKVDVEYTPDARARRITGTVVLEVIVRKDGSVEVIRIVKSLDPELDEQAIVALRQWKFEPATRNGQPVDVSINAEVNFNLK